MIERHRISGKFQGVSPVELDALGRRDSLLKDAVSRGGECAGIIDDVAGRKRAKRRIEVVEAWVGEFQGNAVHAELIRDNVCGCAVGARTKTHAEVAAIAVPNAITGPFQRKIFG